MLLHPTLDKLSALRLTGMAAGLEEQKNMNAIADLVPADARPFALDRSALRITVFGDHGRAVEVRGCKG